MIRWRGVLRYDKAKGRTGSDDDEAEEGGEGSGEPGLLKGADRLEGDAAVVITEEETERRARIETQSEVNKTAFADEGDETRGKLLGLDVGSYVRVEFTQVPAELVRNFQVRRCARLCARLCATVRPRAPTTLPPSPRSCDAKRNPILRRRLPPPHTMSSAPGHSR